MGFVILIAIGAILGWMAAILSRADDAQETVQNVAAGLAGALLGGVLMSTQSLLTGLSASALASGSIGALLALGVFHLARFRTVR